MGTAAVSPFTGTQLQRLLCEIEAATLLSVPSTMSEEL